MILASSNANAVEDRANIIRIGTILSNPPYVLESPSRGIDLDILKAVFRRVGMKTVFVHAPLPRVPSLLESGMVDAMTAIRLADSSCQESDPFSVWHDGVTVTQDKAESVVSLADLSGLSVGMFPGAERVLDEVIGEHVHSFSRRVTIHSTPLVVRMLAYGRIDAYIGDYWALEYAAMRAKLEHGLESSFVTVIPFRQTLRKLCLRDHGLIEPFNRALAAAKETGEIEDIVQGYLGGMPLEP